MIGKRRKFGNRVDSELFEKKGGRPIHSGVSWEIQPLDFLDEPKTLQGPDRRV
jgi:hypothetical protein